MSMRSNSTALYCCSSGHVIIARSGALSLIRHCPSCHHRSEFSRFPQTPRTQHCHICLMPVAEA